MKTALAIGRISARVLFKELQKKAPYFCTAREKKVEITNIFFKHVVEHKKNIRPEVDFLQRFFIIPHIKNIIKNGICTETREEKNGLYHKISLQVEEYIFSIIIVKHRSKDVFLLLSCFNDEKLSQEKKGLFTPSMESYDQSRSSLYSKKTLSQKKISVNTLLIGAGNMGSAIGKALLEKKFLQAKNFFVTDKHPENLNYFAGKNCEISNDAKNFLPKADIVILAVKPQISRELLSHWRKKFNPKTLLISIAAGVSCSDLEKFSGLHRCIRVMPNTPLLVNKGVSGYYFSGNFKKEEKEKITAMMRNFGLAIECESEEKINAITALSGSGPAYFFRLLELMSQQGENFGFTQEESEKISLQTLQGAGLLAENSAENFSTLRKKVTSRGGTTEAALNYFEENNLKKIWKGGMIAAKNRAEEL